MKLKKWGSFNGLPNESNNLKWPLGKCITKIKPSTVRLLKFFEILAANFTVKDVNVTGSV